MGPTQRKILSWGENFCNLEFKKPSSPHLLVISKKDKTKSY